MEVLTPEAAINAGRQHYSAKRYKAALEQFTRVWPILRRQRLLRLLISLGHAIMSLRDGPEEGQVCLQKF